MQMLKYTPEYTRIATRLSMVPVTLPNIGFCAFNSLSKDAPEFRVTATGVVLDVFKVQPKLLRKTS